MLIEVMVLNETDRKYVYENKVGYFCRKRRRHKILSPLYTFDIIVFNILISIYFKTFWNILMQWQYIVVYFIYWTLFLIYDPMPENQPNHAKAFLSVRSFKEKKVNNSRTPEPIFLKFCDIVHECNCQLFMWSANFSCAEKTIKSCSENGGNFINKNWYLRPENIVILFSLWFWMYWLLLYSHFIFLM